MRGVGKEGKDGRQESKAGGIKSVKKRGGKDKRKATKRRKRKGRRDESGI